LQNLIKFINDKTDNKFDFLKLSNVIYNKTENSVKVHLLYPDEQKTINTQDRQKITNLTKDFVGLDLNLQVKFVKSFYDEEYLKTVISNFNKNEHPSLVSLIKTDNLKLTQHNENAKITLNYLGDYLTKDQINKYLKKLNNYLNNEFCYSFEVEINKIDKPESDKAIQQNKMKVLNNLYNEQSKEQQKNVKVEVVDQLVGSDASVTPLCVSSVKQPDKNVSVAGTIKYFSEREFTRKQKAVGGNEQTYVNVTKTYYSFVIESAGKQLNAVYFPNKNSKDKLDNVKDGLEVVLTGDVEEFNDKLSIKVKHITLVKILEKPKNVIQFKSVNASYKQVFPEDFDVVAQASLFEQQKQQIDYLKNNTFVVFDLETTGLNHEDCQIVEIGAVKVENGKITKKFSTFVDPETNIPEDATKIHGITNEMVKGAPKVKVALEDFYKFAHKSTLVAYNIAFDYKFINHYGRKHRLKFSHPQKDAMIMARKYIKGLRNYKLKTVAESLNVSLANAHRAYFDAAATAKVFLKLAENLN